MPSSSALQTKVSAKVAAVKGFKRLHTREIRCHEPIPSSKAYCIRKNGPGHGEARTQSGTWSRILGLFSLQTNLDTALSGDLVVTSMMNLHRVRDCQYRGTVFGRPSMNRCAVSCGNAYLADVSAYVN